MVIPVLLIKYHCSSTTHRRTDLALISNMASQTSAFQIVKLNFGKKAKAPLQTPVEANLVCADSGGTF